MSLPPGKVIEDDPPVPVQGQPASKFAGRGAFTAHDPQSLIRRGVADKFAWVALKGDANDHAVPGDAQALRAAGVRRIMLWYSFDEPRNVLYPGDVLAGAQIGQDEGPGQRAAATDPHSVRCDALVSNSWAATFPPGFVVLAEEYWNVDSRPLEQLIGGAVSGAKNRGATEAYPVFGVGGPWAEANRVVPLEDYCKIWGPTDFSIYLGEQLSDADVAFLQGLA